MNVLMEPCWMNVLMEDDGACWMNVLMEDDGALLDECVDGALIGCLVDECVDGG